MASAERFFATPSGTPRRRRLNRQRPVEPAPVVTKGKQSFTTPKRGVTVIVKKGAKTDAGQPVTTKVEEEGQGHGDPQEGAIKVRTFDKKGWGVTVTQTAPGTDTNEPFSQRVVYVNGKRR